MTIISLPLARYNTKFVRLNAVPHRVFHLFGQWYLAIPRYDMLNLRNEHGR